MKEMEGDPRNTNYAFNILTMNKTKSWRSRTMRTAINIPGFHFRVTDLFPRMKLQSLTEQKPTKQFACVTAKAKFWWFGESVQASRKLTQRLVGKWEFRNTVFSLQVLDALTSSRSDIVHSNL